MKTIKATLSEWQSKKRRMGCVSATKWFCKRHKNFWPIRLRKTIKRGKCKGEIYEHVIATNGKMFIDLAPYADKPSFR